MYRFLHRSAAWLAVAVFMLSTTACGGGGGSPALSDEEVEELRSDPRIVRAERIQDRANTLSMSALRAEFAGADGGIPINDHLIERYTCTGARCSGSLGTQYTLFSLGNSVLDADLTAVTIGSSYGFDTAAVTARLDLSDALPGITRFPDGTEFGAWGEHGYAAIALFNGDFAGRFDGVSVNGRLASTLAVAMGDATGTNPDGAGGATWRGMAHAVSTGSYTRRDGTASVRIPDLAQPSVDVTIQLGDQALAPWTGIPLVAGRFRTGTQDRDFIDGRFFGPDHDETYGVFDTHAYVGMFAARAQ